MLHSASFHASCFVGIPAGRDEGYTPAGCPPPVPPPAVRPGLHTACTHTSIVQAAQGAGKPRFVDSTLQTILTLSDL